ncbi:hypothetical protein ASE73_07725 [Sphingomonas sp. Leaf24]|uniref:hypothetical protein n=1 Tax=unclassified Sphingomonas TaxID=196159 RepID=UPI0006FF17D9|nr:MULTISPECIES: hypothetical protein [unclassified Sphingomonas]KQM20203.1 hypothetical protein ASE50_16840 [Sphingomonas sp. Leaf5]KQM89465.1 hypothetical protein ASE73_07725 [Sphingomonas sp. Leaf24]
MAKTHYTEITPQLLHTVATLTAAGVRISPIALRVGVTYRTIQRVMQVAEWEAVLAKKTAQIEAMMRGDA